MDTSRNEYGIEFRIGDRVRLRDKSATALIDGIYSEGRVLLDRKLDGLRWWNVNDLERVPRQEGGHR